MTFGTNTVTFKRLVKVGVPDDLGEYAMESIETVVSNCRHRPLTPTEKVDMNFDIATQPWKTTIPIGEYDSDTLAAITLMKPDDFIEIDGQEYQIIGGISQYPDMDGLPFKATIISKKQIG